MDGRVVEEPAELPAAREVPRAGCGVRRVRFAAADRALGLDFFVFDVLADAERLSCFLADAARAFCLLAEGVFPTRGDADLELRLRADTDRFCRALAAGVRVLRFPVVVEVAFVFCFLRRMLGSPLCIVAQRRYGRKQQVPDWRRARLVNGERGGLRSATMLATAIPSADDSADAKRHAGDAMRRSSREQTAIGAGENDACSDAG